MPRRQYLVNRTNGTKFRINGAEPSTELPSKANLSQQFSDIIQLSSDQLPPGVDLRPLMTPVENQGQVGTCTANATAGAYEYLLKQTYNQDIDVSRLFIYYNSRAIRMNGPPTGDTGSSLVASIETLEETGVCLESIWPYDISSLNTRPSQEAYQVAQDHKITEAFQLKIDSIEMKTCLAQGFPFGFCIKLYTSFDKGGKTGVVSVPDQSEESRKEHGRHAMLAVGYSEQSRVFIVRNSWGTNWGAEGYCFLPYDYLANSAFCFEAWMIRHVQTNDIGHDYWNNDDVNYQGDDDDNDDDDKAITESGDDEDDGDQGNGNDQGGYNDQGDYNDQGNGNDQGDYNDQGNGNDQGDYNDQGNGNDQGDYNDQGNGNDQGDYNDQGNGNDQGDFNDQGNGNDQGDYNYQGDGYDNGQQ